jgi:hypothetical protein
MTLEATDTETVPWNIMRSDDKKRARRFPWSGSKVFALSGQPSGQETYIVKPRGAGHAGITGGVSRCLS